MQIVCPACQTRYDVPDQRLAPGRRVRCAQCGDGWTPLPPVVEILPPGPPPPDPAIPPPGIFTQAVRPAEPVTPTRAEPDRALKLGWLATFVLLIAAILLAHLWRVPIEHAWPPSIRLYDLF